MTVDELRSRTMRAVKSKDTKPEIAVRKIVHALGFRFRLHRTDLPGSPDLVLPSKRKAIFVHGCFWHGHTCARGSRKPRANADYWAVKIRRNIERDARVRAGLKNLGWKTLVIWECELKTLEKLQRRIQKFLAS
jgi:DNA mismatch endonuclease (patch repair protein)